MPRKRPAESDDARGSAWIRHDLAQITRQLESLMSSAADLTAALAALATAVQKIAEEVAALKAAQPPLDQAGLDAATAAVTDATTKLSSL